MSEVDAGNSFVLPTFAELILIVEKGKLLNDVVHYEINVDRRLVTYHFLVGLTKLAHVRNIKSLVWIKLKHPSNNSLQFWGVLII